MTDLVPTASAPLPSFGNRTPLERLQTLAAQPAIKRALPWFLGLTALAGAALTYTLLAPSPQRMLYSQLSDSERAGVVEALDKAAIGYTIDSQTGALTVAESELYRARMLVAADGALAAPENGTAGLDSLPLGASRTLEGERLRSAREHELTLTIMEIDGVEAVRVHLAEPARSVFVRDDAPPTASVMVRVARGRQLADGQVAAVVNLVAGSVPGLSPDSVRVADQHGRLLSDRTRGNSDRLELQGRMEQKLRTQLDQLLTPILGAGNFTSEIQLELDMDQITSAHESYDKEGVIRSETQAQSQTAGTGAAMGVPGMLSNTPPPAVTATPGPPQGTTPATAPPTATGETSASRTYELGREVAVANSAPGKVKRLSVAVALSQAAMKKSKASDVEQIKQLISAAVGANPQRGDQVAVVMHAFEPVRAEVLPFYELPWFAMVVRSAAALLALLLVLMLGVRPLIRVLKRPPGEAATSLATPATTPVSSAVDAALLGRQVNLAQRIVEEKPDSAVLALRQMLGQPKPEQQA